MLTERPNALPIGYINFLCTFHKSLMNVTTIQKVTSFYQFQTREFPSSNNRYNLKRRGSSNFNKSA